VNAVFVLWLRQLKRYFRSRARTIGSLGQPTLFLLDFRSRARMIGSLGQPTLFLLALGFGLGPTFARAGGHDYVQLWRRASSRWASCSPPSSAASKSSGTASSGF
jgi:ABC-2 type transport system permease protein